MRGSATALVLVAVCLDKVLAQTGCAHGYGGMYSLDAHNKTLVNNTILDPPGPGCPENSTSSEVSEYTLVDESKARLYVCAYLDNTTTPAYDFEKLTTHSGSNDCEHDAYNHTTIVNTPNNHNLYICFRPHIDGRNDLCFDGMFSNEDTIGNILNEEKNSCPDTTTASAVFGFYGKLTYCVNSPTAAPTQAETTTPTVNPNPTPAPSSNAPTPGGTQTSTPAPSDTRTCAEAFRSAVDWSYDGAWHEIHHEFTHTEEVTFSGTCIPKGTTISVRTHPSHQSTFLDAIESGGVCSEGCSADVKRILDTCTAADDRDRPNRHSYPEVVERLKFLCSSTLNAGSLVRPSGLNGLLFPAFASALTLVLSPA